MEDVQNYYLSRTNSMFYVFMLFQRLSVRCACVSINCSTFICVLFSKVCTVKSIHDFIFLVVVVIPIMCLCVALPFDEKILRSKLHTICALKFYFLCLCVSHTMRNKTASIGKLVTNTSQNDMIEIETRISNHKRTKERI